ncbi:heptaprenylglyceryl phosphate synthase [Natrialbaceae archaeon A-arb3/5]
MELDWDDITHVTKVDPAKPLPADIEVLDGTDLVVVGGSDGVTDTNTLETVETIASSFPDQIVCQEPDSAEHVSSDTIDAVDYLAVPAVYNGDREHFVGKHVELFTEIGRKPETLLGSSVPLVGDYIASKGADAISNLVDKLFAEGYVIQHRDSAAAARSGVETKYSPEQVAGAALATESFYDFPVFYVEYSGTYGGPEDVEAAATYLSETTLFYGGGIDSREKAEEILAAGADAIVVGDCFHDDPDAFRETVPTR